MLEDLKISKEKVKKCLSNGLAVVEGNAEYDLKQFPDLSFWLRDSKSNTTSFHESGECN
mgnify:CR=1 FL=1